MFSDPVVGSDFFGRQDIVDLLVKRASALQSGYRQNVAIIGHRQLGKTSILRHFLHITRDPQILTIYVEIKFQALDYFVDQFIRSLLFQQLAAEGGADPMESLAALARKAAPKIPKTVARIEEIDSLLKHRHAEEAYSKLFELTSVIRGETGKHCIVVLDEFHRLGEFGIKNAFSDFGKRIMTQKDTMYLLSSSSFSASRRILAEKLALLFGNFERIYLEAFDFETSLDFLEKKTAPVVMPPALKSYLVALTDGQPFFLDTISARVRELSMARQEREVSRGTVTEVLFNLLYESQGVLHQYFLKLISPWTQMRSRGSQLLILAQIAKGRNKLKDIASAINRGQKETSRQIRELMEHELVVKTGMFYRFHDKTFKFWLAEVYEKKELSPLGAGGGREGFLARVQAAMAEFEELLRMDSVDRVLGLFCLFKNEIVELGEKKRKLPHFTEFIRGSEAKGLPPGSSRALVAKGHGRCWVCKIVEEKATEKEILDLVGRAGSKDPAHTKVLVALKGFEENAKLLAKEKRILTLGLSRINMLMDLYGKYPIIHLSATKASADVPPAKNPPAPDILPV